MTSETTALRAALIDIERRVVANLKRSPNANLVGKTPGAIKAGTLRNVLAIARAALAPLSEAPERAAEGREAAIAAVAKAIGDRVIPGTDLGLAVDAIFALAPPSSDRIADARREALEEKLKQAQRRIADRDYMLNAYLAMLGPKGRAVAQMWRDKGVMRQHTSWGPEAASLSGEERAQVLLDVEAAPKTPLDFDGPSTGEPQESYADRMARVSALTPSRPDREEERGS